jgi:FkbM family methyltransferase
MNSAARLLLRWTPGPAKRLGRRLLRPPALGWLRLRARLFGVPGSADAYDPLTRRLALEFDGRLPVRARLRNGLAIDVVWRDHVSEHILRDGCYEPETVALFERYLEPGMVVLDVGAHIGQYSLIAGRCVAPSGSVHAFEPDPATFAWLERNCHRELTNVRTARLALSDASGTRTFYFATTHDIGSNSLAEPLNFSGRKAQVPCMRLDDYLQEQGVARVHLVKMDVEGAELAVLRGGEKLFSSAERPPLIMEFEEKRQRAFGTSCRALGAWLVERGYALYRVGAKLEPYTPGDSDPRSLNVLALPVGMDPSRFSARSPAAAPGAAPAA